jgi:hypothetical protein
MDFGDDYLGSIWWVMHHSRDAERIAAVLYCYLDESATDGGPGSPVAVVGGLILQPDTFYCLDIEWGKAIAKHHVEPSVHMKEFGRHGRFGNWTHEQRASLFTDLTSIINEHKTCSISATLTTKEYNAHFGWLASQARLSIYSICFLLLAVVQAKHANQETYAGDIPFLLDGGNPHAEEVREAHTYLMDFCEKDSVSLGHPGSLTFGDDNKLRALQAADVIVWTVSRSVAADTFKNGFEPLATILESRHIQQPFEEEWMAESSNVLRERQSRPRKLHRATAQAD